MTPAETYTKVQAYIYNRDVVAANFRRLFALQYNQWAKQGHQMKEWSLWPLSIDKTEIDEQEAEEMYKRNREIERQILERRAQNKP